MKSKKLFMLELAPVRRAMEAWRKPGRPRQRIPETLWAEMAALARRHGVSAVSQALGLDYYKLKRRVAEMAGGPSALMGSEFVELKLASSDGTPACLAQLEDGRGRKLTLRWAVAPGAELVGLVQAFWKESS